MTPSPLSMTMPVSVRSPTCRDVQDAAKASTAWMEEAETVSTQGNASRVFCLRVLRLTDKLSLSYSKELSTCPILHPPHRPLLLKVQIPNGTARKFSILKLDGSSFQYNKPDVYKGKPRRKELHCGVRRLKSLSHSFPAWVCRWAAVRSLVEFFVKTDYEAHTQTP